MKSLKMLFICLILILVAGSMITLSCSCDDDDDDDDDLLGGGGNGDCDGACEQAFDCGGNFWYEDQAECQSLCEDWLQTSVGCSECFIGCFSGEDGCLEAGQCMLACSFDECLEALEELDSYL